MRPVTLCAAAAMLVSGTPLLAHHSDAALDLNALHTIEGVVTEYRMRNPHSYFTLETAAANGEPTEWTVQMGSALSVTRRGLDTRHARGGRPGGGRRASGAGRTRLTGCWRTLEKDGIPVQYERFRARQTGAATDSLEGVWITDRASLGPDYPGGFDELTRAELTLTGARTAGQRRVYPRTPRRTPSCGAITKPTPGGIVYTDTYPIQIEFNDADDTLIIRSQFFDQVRTVYMDGRAHPPGG